ncbi:MAG: hypothetical protein ABIC91_08375 [Nanoarchaeota archaeon]|nr:hypothetical protein [Nanoarchaeota archaeon]MBU1030347.1 hypothetical protein [Nanoarchaeota archaeon]MBU1849807.1 hypothetical protein [Nanoarchaeota archaeon]
MIKMTLDKITKEEAEAYYSSVEDELIKKSLITKLADISLISFGVGCIPAIFFGSVIFGYMCLGGLGGMFLSYKLDHRSTKKRESYIENLKADINNQYNKHFSDSSNQ